MRLMPKVEAYAAQAMRAVLVEEFGDADVLQMRHLPFPAGQVRS